MLPLKSLIPAVLAVTQFAILTSGAAADELTPSGGTAAAAVKPAATAPAPDTQPKLSFEQAAQSLTAVFPVRLDRFDQVVQNSFNWHGAEDASLHCDLGFTADAFVVRGEFRDDHPFFQTRLHPSRPDWWRIQYGADGLEFNLDDPTSAARRSRLALNFSSAAVDPQVELISGPGGRAPGFIPSASVVLQDAESPSGQPGTIQFKAAVPLEALGPREMFSGSLRITVRLHDLDGDMATYLMMQEAVEKR